MKKPILKKSLLAFVTICSLQLTAQNFYINKVWENESTLLSGQQNHARTLLDQSNNVLTVANKKNSSSANIFSNKINASGIETWQTEITNFLNTIGTENHGTDIKKDAQGNIFICGANFNGTNYDYLVVKYNASGVELWRRAYNGTGNSDDVPSSMALDASGNVYVTGASFGINTMTDFATLKLNGQNGNIIWTSRYDFSNKYDGATQVKLDNQGNVLVCGSSAQNLTDADFVVIKYNPSNGNQTQIKRHNTPQNGFDIAIGMEIDANNNVYVVGTANSNLPNKDIKVIAYNPNLQISWIRYIDENGLEDEVTGIVKDAYNDLILTGSTKNLQNEINTITAKISRVNGNIIWKVTEQNQGEITKSVGKGISADLNGNTVIVSEVLKNNVSHIKAFSYDINGQKRWEYVNENTALTHQKPLDILVKGKDVILTGTKGTSTGESLITVKLEQKDIIIAPDFNGEPSVTSYGLETNAGQLLNDDFATLASNVKFYNDRMNPAVFVTDNNIVLGFQQGQPDSTVAVHRIDMDFVNSNPVKNIINRKEDEQAGIKNYYLQHKPEGILGIKEHSRIIMADVYPNVDVQYYSGINGMKYYMVVKPGANPDDILLRFTGSSSINLNANGSLDVHSAYGHITYDSPIAYQLDANNQPVQIQGEGYFIQVDAFTVKFFVKTYQNDKTLFIQLEEYGTNDEPVRSDNLKWSTFYGGVNYDSFSENAVDNQGDVYFTGTSNGLGFPRISGDIYVFFGSSIRRIVVGKHRSGGIRDWSTLYGAEYDGANSIATDNYGNVYVAGVSGTYNGGSGTNYGHHFLTQPKTGAYNQAPVNPAQASNFYAFLIKFNQTDGQRTWATLFGENIANSLYDASSISCDIEGNVYIAGRGYRLGNAPIVAQGAAYVDSVQGVNKAFIAKFDAFTNALSWSTLFGNHYAYIRGIKAYGHSSLFVTGITSQVYPEDFPFTEEHPGGDYFDTTYNGGATDAFIARFDPGNSLKYATFLGGSGDDVALSISMSPENQDVAICGHTTSPAPSFPIQQIGNGFPLSNLASQQDAFLTILDLTVNGYEIKYSTYWGQNDFDRMDEVRYSQTGDLFIIGTAKSTDLNNIMTPMANAYRQDFLANDSLNGVYTNAFLIGMDTAYNFVWSTYFGGQPNDSFPTLASFSDYGFGVAVYYNRVYIVGQTFSQTNFPIKSGDAGAYFQPDNGSGYNYEPDPNDYADGYIAEFDLSNTAMGTSLGMDELVQPIIKNQFILFPNPTDGNVMILDKTKSLNNLDGIEILDISGKVVKKITNLQYLNSNAVSFDISDLPTGFYNVVLLSKEETTTMKLIKK